MSDLALAITEGHISYALELIDKGYDTNEVYNGQPILTHAVEKSQPSVVEALIHKGANPNLQNYIGNTPLMSLLAIGKTEYNEAYEAFIEARNTYNEVSNEHEPTPSNIIGVRTGFAEILQMLLEVSDLSIKNKYGNNALMVAVENETINEDVIQYIIAAGALVDAYNNDGYTVFHLFANRHNADQQIRILEALTRPSSPEIINAATVDGSTALDLAIIADKYKTAEHLLYKGAKLTPVVIEMANETNYGPLLEVVEHLMRSEEVLPTIKPTDIEVLFGVELEICVKLTPECTQEYDKRLNSNIFYAQPWSNLFAMFAKFILKKSSLAEKMRNRYEYMYVSGGKKYSANYVLNLSTFDVETMPATMKIAYDKPFFTIDRSVICADYKTKVGYSDPRPIYMPAIEDTFHIELVSPIMTNLEELKDLLEFLGMQRPSCFVANDSAGFHVNVSLRNRLTQKPIPLTSDFFTRTFFPHYKVWEAQVYPKVRPEIDMPYAKCIGGTDAERYPDLYHEICSNKYVSLHRKPQRQLVEFRLFGSSNKLADLLYYTRIATEFLRSCYLKWYFFYRPTIDSTNQQIVQKQVNLKKSLLNLKSRLRTRKTKGLLIKRNNIQRNLRTLATLREKNAATRASVLKTITHKSAISSKGTRRGGKGKSGKGH